MPDAASISSDDVPLSARMAHLRALRAASSTFYEHKTELLSRSTWFSFVNDIRLPRNIVEYKHWSLCLDQAVVRLVRSFVLSLVVTLL